MGVLSNSCPRGVGIPGAAPSHTRACADLDPSLRAQLLCPRDSGHRGCHSLDSNECDHHQALVPVSSWGPQTVGTRTAGSIPGASLSLQAITPVLSSAVRKQVGRGGLWTSPGVGVRRPQVRFWPAWDQACAWASAFAPLFQSLPHKGDGGRERTWPTSPSGQAFVTRKETEPVGRRSPWGEGEEGARPGT